MILFKKRPYERFRLNRWRNNNDVINFFTIYENGVQWGRYKHIIKFFKQNKHYGGKRFLKEFPYKRWSRSGLNKIIRKIDRTRTSKRLPGSGRSRTARTAEKICLHRRQPASCLETILPWEKSFGHNLRTRAHNFLLPEKDDRNFVSRSMLNSKLRIFFYFI